MWRFLTFKAEEGPNPEGPAGLFPDKMCSWRGGGASVAADGIQSLQRSSLGCSGLGSSAPKALRPQGLGRRGSRPAQPLSNPLAQPGTGRGRTAARLDRMRPAPGSTRSPCRNPGNVASPGSIWTASRQEEDSNLVFRGCFCTKSPQAFQRREVEALGVRNLPTCPGRLCRSKAPNPRSQSIQTALLDSKSLLCI